MCAGVDRLPPDLRVRRRVRLARRCVRGLHVQRLPGCGTGIGGAAGTVRRGGLRGLLHGGPPQLHLRADGAVRVHRHRLLLLPRRHPPRPFGAPLSFMRRPGPFTVTASCLITCCAAMPFDHFKATALMQILLSYLLVVKTYSSRRPLRSAWKRLLLEACQERLCATPAGFEPGRERPGGGGGRQPHAVLRHHQCHLPAPGEHPSPVMRLWQCTIRCNCPEVAGCSSQREMSCTGELECER